MGYAIMRYFRYQHLPDKLQLVSKPFSDLADAITQLEFRDEEEMKECLRKLLEAKDCAVRSVI